MAHLSGDAGLLAAFHGNQDIHRATAAEVFGLPLDEVDTNQRRAAKAINFGLMYGMSAFGLARQLGVGRGEAQDYMARYFSRYPGVREFMDRMREQAHRDGYVETRVRPAPASRLHQLDATRCSAPAPSAPRSMRRCRAPRPTSSSAR